jgi:glc operon protein GlcG
MKRSILPYVLPLLLLAIPLAASAQAPAAASPLTVEVARRIIDAAEAEARANQWNVTLVVVDAAGVPVYLRRMDGASPRSFDFAIGKARTSASTGLATREYAERVSDGRMQPVEGGLTIEGGVPIRLGGEVVGSIGVSGVPAVSDGQIARAGVAAVEGR